MGNTKNIKRRNYSRKKNKRLDRRGPQGLPTSMDTTSEEISTPIESGIAIKVSHSDTNDFRKEEMIAISPELIKQHIFDNHQKSYTNTYNHSDAAQKDSGDIYKDDNQQSYAFKISSFHESHLNLHDQNLHGCRKVKSKKMMHELESFNSSESAENITMISDSSQLSAGSILLDKNQSNSMNCNATISSSTNSISDYHMPVVEVSNSNSRIVQMHEFSNNLHCTKNVVMNGTKKIHFHEALNTKNQSMITSLNKITVNTADVSINNNMHVFNVDSLDNNYKKVYKSNVSNSTCETSLLIPIRTYSKLSQNSMKVYQAKHQVSGTEPNFYQETTNEMMCRRDYHYDNPVHKPKFTQVKNIADKHDAKLELEDILDLQSRFQLEESRDTSDASNARFQQNELENISDDLGARLDPKDTCKLQNKHQSKTSEDASDASGVRFPQDESENISDNLGDRLEPKDTCNLQDDHQSEASEDTFDASGVRFQQDESENSSDDSSTRLLLDESENNSSDFSANESMDSDNESSNRLYYEEPKIQGRRITDLSRVFEQLHYAFDSHDDSCEGRFKDLRIRQIMNKGLRTLMTWECRNCKKIARIWTDPDEPSDRLNLHDGATLGTLIAGSGCSALQEQFAAMDIPFISQVSYRDYRSRIGKTIYKVALEEMKKAGQLELELARQAGDIVKGRNGKPDRPFITVIVDGAWSKRSYRGGRYDALSGTAVIIGQRTGLVLWCGIRNKCCTGCERNSEHPCVKNWGRDQASTSMETDIITEGFRNSIEMHGLIYKYVVGDGDSSVYKSIVDNDPYAEYSVRVDKIECKNHLFRNFCNHMEEVAKKTKFVCDVKRGLVKSLREEVKTSALKMRVHIEQAMVRRKNEGGTLEEKTTRLLNDITNTPYHIFGEHANCEKNDNGELIEICKNISENKVAFLRKVGMLTEIETQVSRLALNVSSLLENATSNAAELYNSLANKFHGGRRINNSMSNSFELRALCAVIQFNNKVILSRILPDLNKPVSEIVLKMEQSRLNQLEYTKKYRENGGRKRRHYYGTDKDYGPFANTEDASLFVYNTRKDDHLKKLKERQRRREEIERETVGQSNCGDWYMYRADIITASHFGEICNKRESTSCAGIVKKIRFSPQLSSESILFGKENEKNAIEELEKKINKKIEPCGLFIDKDLEYLGASPDGLIDADGIVEIKCLASARNLTPNEAIEKNTTYRSIFNKKIRI